MRKLLLAACLLFLGALASAAESQKRAITHPDLWLMPRIGNPVVSPDGKWVVFSLTQPAYDPREEGSDLWIVSTAGGEPPRRLTASKSEEGYVDWSPDSQKIVFTAKREGDEAAQVYALDLSAGGEAERLTTLSTGARAPKWSPDGRRILFLSDVYPGAGDDQANRKAAREAKERKYNVRAYERLPVRHWDKWVDERRAHIFVQDAAPGARPRDLFAGTKLEKLPGFGGKLGETGEELPATWTPDSRGVVFVASMNLDQIAYSEMDTDLFLSSVDGGEPQRLTIDPDSYGQPVFTPDGQSLVLGVTAGRNGHSYNLKRLARYPWPLDVSKREVLTADFDRVPGEPVISGDGRRVYFTSEDAGIEKLYSVPIEGGPVEVESEVNGGVVTNLDGNGRGADFRLAALWDSATQPAELYAFTPGDKKPRALTRFTESVVSNLDLFPVEHLWVQNSQGQRVHSLVIRPAEFDPRKKYPLVVFLHGGPHLMGRDSFGLRWNFHLLAGSDFVVVVPNYSGSAGFGEAFARAVEGTPLKASADDVNLVVAEVARRYEFVDGSRVAIAGASYGAHIVNWLEATSNKYKCFVAHAGLVNLESQWATSDKSFDREVAMGGPVWDQGSAWRDENPVRFAGNYLNGTGWVTPILITAGEKDFRVPLNNALETWTYLQRLKVPSRLLVFPDENHWITRGEDSRYWYSEVRGWLKRWLAERQ